MPRDVAASCGALRPDAMSSPVPVNLILCDANASAGHLRLLSGGPPDYQGHWPRLLALCEARISKDVNGLVEDAACPDCRTRAGLPPVEI